jgi:hypothetical protein
VTLTKRLAALLVVLTAALAASVLAAGTASAATGGGCRKPPVTADSLTVSTCVTATGPSTAYGNVRTSGTNNTLINLCVELVDANQSLVPGSRDCQTVPGADGAVSTPTMSLGSGTYYAVSYFTSPTYWYGGESPALHI